mgnify:CR=1 FL=1|jgi:hypothetical protein
MHLQNAQRPSLRQRDARPWCPAFFEGTMSGPIGKPAVLGLEAPRRLPRLRLADADTTPIAHPVHALRATA